MLGEFQTLVNPHTQIPPFIAVLTGITNSMVGQAPSIESVLPSFLEFAAGSVLVAHNAPFDVGFLKWFAARQGIPWPAFEVLDTAKIARRVITRDDAPNCKLSSLARVFHAIDDAQPPGPVRRPGDRRRAPRADGAPRRPRRAHPRGALDVQREGLDGPAPQALPRRGPPPRSGRLPLPRRAVTRPLRRHLPRPAHPRALLLHRVRDPVAHRRDGRDSPSPCPASSARPRSRPRCASSG